MARLERPWVGRTAAGVGLLLSWAAFGGASGAASPQAPASEIEKVRAFARLYGVVRYFYPSDAAAELDWERFARHGVARARAAGDAFALRDALDSLVAPLGPGIVVARALPPAPASAAAAPEPLVAWQYLGPGFANRPGLYAAQRLGRARPPGIDGFVTLMQNVPAEGLRGRTVRLRGRARVAARDGSGQGALWLRVDRPAAMGYFDNMGNRPIREPDWREFAIEGPVADDAVRVAFGVMAFGTATADFDAIDLSVRAPADGDWTAVAIADPGFEAAATAASGWFRAGTSKHAVLSWPTEGAPAGARFLRLAPPSSVPAEPLFPGPALGAGEHVDVALGSGLRARVPIVLTDSQAKADGSRQPALDALHRALAALPAPAAEPDLDTRLADVVVAWNVYRHFYPYWPETAVDWEARLPLSLQAARSAGSRAEQRDALRRLVADARDGHGSVNDGPAPEPQGSLPLQLALVEEKLVVTASAEANVPVGSVVTELDGEPALARFQRALDLASGSIQWKRTRAIGDLLGAAPGTPVRLAIEEASGGRSVTLRSVAGPPPLEKRPEPVGEIAPGVFYVDLTRAAMSVIEPVLERMAASRGVVFDVRGYPTGDAHRVLAHLIAAPESDRWMHVARIVGPFGRTAGWQSEGWRLRPASPPIAAPRVFLTDGRAISYAESVLGHVADLKLGRVVGGATAGTNGDVVSFQVPSGFSIHFTGMRVTRHDGRTPFHLRGVQPDVPVAPTIAGLRAGRDEVLERGLELLRDR